MLLPLQMNMYSSMLTYPPPTHTHMMESGKEGRSLSALEVQQLPDGHWSVWRSHSLRRQRGLATVQPPFLLTIAEAGGERCCRGSAEPPAVAGPPTLCLLPFAGPLQLGLRSTLLHRLHHCLRGPTACSILRGAPYPPIPCTPLLLPYVWVVL